MARVEAVKWVPTLCLAEAAGRLHTAQVNLAIPTTWPEAITSEAQLDEVLTRPSLALIQFITSVASPLLVLGAGGKMGPTLAVLAKRAAEAAKHPLEVIAVSRFSNPTARAWLEERQVKTLSCDLLEAGALQKLPETENLIYMVGMKFGSTQKTWQRRISDSLRSFMNPMHEGQL